ncbi:MAG: N-acetylmuramoyl-L-alanine amidase [Proteobacteria bacterium]|nr:N-acetylmuramoyl-L-alanine amidase [Pseudomonadota bacterium]
MNGYGARALSAFIAGIAVNGGRRGLQLRMIFMLSMCLLAAPYASLESLAQEQGVLGRAIHLVEEPDGEGAGLVIDLSAETTHRVDILAAPDRLVLDLDRTAFQAGTQLSSAKPTGPVLAYRAGLFMAGQSRIVIELARPALIERADFVRQNGIARLVVQIRPVAPERFRAEAEAAKARRLASRAPEEALIERKPGAKPLIVLDPGHGGIDPGASGPKGEAEKDIVLAYAKAIAARLTAEGKVEVILTRDDDRFIALRERVAFARAKGASLFVSLHADSLFGEADVRGASVYTLSDRASDAAAERAAEKENRADIAAGIDPGEDKREGVEDILFDLARRETRLFSQIAAREAAAAFRRSGRLHKVPLRAAGFRVLRAPDMPSILIEIGYLSSPEDLAALLNEATRDKVSAQLAEALQRFVVSGRDAINIKAPE